MVIPPYVYTIAIKKPLRAQIIVKHRKLIRK